MDTVYSVHRPQISGDNCYSDWTVKGRRLLSVSTRGLVAFTSSFCLSHIEPRTVSYHIYVADVNTPYQPYLLAESDYDITVLEWDPTSKKLLTCTTRGTVTIYTSKDYLISDWKPHYIKEFPGEVFLNGLWYHHGISTCINLEKVTNLTDGNYSDKFQQTNFGASVKLFGRKAAEGCILLTQTGLVCCVTLLADGSILMDTDCLDGYRSKIKVADVAYRKNGGFLMATTAGHINSMISFYLIDLRLKNVCLDDVEPSTPTTTRLSLSCQNFCSFYLNLTTQILQDKELLDASSADHKIGFHEIGHVKFDTKNAPKEIFVEVSGTNLSLIELWTLESEKPLPPVHPSILSHLNESNTSEYTTQDFVHSIWSFYGNYINEQELVTMTTPRFPLFSSGYQLNLIFLTYRDHTVRCLRKDDLQQLFQPLDLAPSIFRKCSPGGRAGDSKNCSFMDRLMALNDSLNKQSSHIIGDSKDKSSPLVVTDFQLSCNQCGAFVIDSLSQIHALKLPLLIDCHDSKDHQTYIQCLLEFCLFTGNDWWDIIIQVEQSTIGSICENLANNFDRQPKYIQEKFFNRQLMIRASLYRCQNSVMGLCKATDCHTMIKLNSISTTLKSILRSNSIDNEYRDSPAEYLEEFLKNQTTLSDYSDCSNLIVKLRNQSKEFVVENNQVQSLQQLNQWIADLAIFLMVSLPQQVQSKHRFPGAGLAFNSSALEMIRELLIIIKIWGLLNESCLPIVHKLNDQFDVISNLFKLVSGAYFTSLNKTDQLDETLLDECCQLANVILIPYLELILYPIGVASPLLYQSPLYLEYNREPSVPKCTKLQSVEGSVRMNGERKIDVVRHISLGAHPRGNIRKCTRCNSISLIKSSFKTNRSWDQRWISSCVCGGSWAQLDSPLC